MFKTIANQMKYIEPLDRYQYQIMSSIEDLVEADHPVRIIDQIVESIISSNKEIFHQERENQVGRPKYYDSTMIKLYLYGYFNGISSSRKLEVEAHRNKEVLWLLGGLKPDHWTISNYRKDNSEQIKFVTKNFREFLKRSGYIKLKTVAIDGSKVKAYTNRDMLTKEKIERRLESIDKKIEEYLNKIIENDNRDNIIDELGNEDTEILNKKYIDRIIELQRKVEELSRQKEILEKEGTKHISSSDTEARLMKSRDGMIPAYNVQIVVDAENKMIADSEVLTEETDLRVLPKMIESIKEELGQTPEEALLDNGYNTPDMIEEEEKEKNIKFYVSQNKKTSRDKEDIKFEYDKINDEFRCSMGKRLVLLHRNKKKKNSYANIYRGIECNGCPMKNKCTKSKKGRTYTRYLNQQWRDQYKEKMGSEIAKEKLSLRKTLVEHPFGTIKYLMGKIPLLLRGVKKVSTEINLYTTVYNIKRLVNIVEFESLMIKITNYQWQTV